MCARDLESQKSSILCVEQQQESRLSIVRDDENPQTSSSPTHTHTPRIRGSSRRRRRRRHPPVADKADTHTQQVPEVWRKVNVVVPPANGL